MAIYSQVNKRHQCTAELTKDTTMAIYSRVNKRYQHMADLIKDAMAIYGWVNKRHQHKAKLTKDTENCVMMHHDETWKLQNVDFCIHCTAAIQY